MKKSQSLRHDQSGLVSFIVSSVIMSLLSLVTIGFVRVMQKEQRESLDRQLSTQAFYAAESGVNDVVKKAAAPGGIAATTSCSLYSSDLETNVLAVDNIGYTCVLYNPIVDSILFDSSVDNGYLTLVRGAVNPVNSIKISWQAKADSAYGAPSGQPWIGKFPPKTGPVSWGNNISAIRVSVYPVNNGGAGFGRDQLNPTAKTFFLYPTIGGTSSIDLGAQQDGSIVNTSCFVGSGDYKCTLAIISLFGGTNDYYVRFRSIYNDSVVSVTGFSGLGSSEKLAGAQAIVDATGKANDLKRRIQVRKSLIPQYFMPEYAISSAQSVCKRLYVGNGLDADNTECANPANPADDGVN